MRAKRAAFHRSNEAMATRELIVAAQDQERRLAQPNRLTSVRRRPGAHSTKARCSQGWWKRSAVVWYCHDTTGGSRMSMACHHPQQDRPAFGQRGVLAYTTLAGGPPRARPQRRSPCKARRDMARRGRLLARVLRGTPHASIPFVELCGLLCRLGFDGRVRGSHHISAPAGLRQILNLQPSGTKAKPYQVKQARGVLLRYGLGRDDDPV